MSSVQRRWSAADHPVLLLGGLALAIAVVTALAPPPGQGALLLLVAAWLFWWLLGVSLPGVAARLGRWEFAFFVAAFTLGKLLRPPIGGLLFGCCAMRFPVWLWEYGRGVPLRIGTVRRAVSLGCVLSVAVFFVLVPKLVQLGTAIPLARLHAQMNQPPLTPEEFGARLEREDRINRISIGGSAALLGASVLVSIAWLRARRPIGRPMGTEFNLAASSSAPALER